MIGQVDKIEFVSKGRWHSPGEYAVFVHEAPDRVILRNFIEEGCHEFRYQGDFVVFDGCEIWHRLPTGFRAGRTAVVRAGLECVHACEFLY